MIRLRMANSSDPPPRDLDSCLLLLSRKPRDLAPLLAAALRDEALAELLRGAKRRKAGRVDPATQIAEAIGFDQRLRGQLARVLDGALQQAATAEGTDGPQFAAWMRSEQLTDWEAAANWLEEKELNWPEPEPVPKPASAEQEPGPDESSGPTLAVTAAGLGAEERVQKLQRQLLEARRALAQAQAEIGAERRRRLAEEQQRQQWAGTAEAERQRATDLKQQLANSNRASSRENELSRELKTVRHDLHIATQKLEWLEEERDDLRQVLEDRDRFESVVEDEVPSFRDRPLTGMEQGLALELSARRERKAEPFRILVVGGGPPQLRHRDKLEEYAEVVGFQAEWRMAEYQSWHRAMDSLQRDMQERFDALIILHWNRTTFTRHAREICDRGGAKPCLTCRYEGFTALRESIQECLRELLLGEARSQA